MAQELRERGPRFQLSRATQRIRLTRRQWMLAAGVGVLVAVFAIDALASLGQVRPGVRAGSLELGGKSRQEAESLLTERAEALVAEPAAFDVPESIAAEVEQVTVAPDAITFLPDVEATLADAMEVGRHGNPLFRFWDRLRTYFSETDVGWTSSAAEEPLDELIASWAERFDDPSVEAYIEAEGTSFTAFEGTAGTELQVPRARRTVIAGLERWPREPLELPFATAQPRTDLQDAQAAASEAEDMVRAPITVTGPDGATAELAPETLAPLIEARPVENEDGWTLEAHFSPERVDEALGPEMAPFERPAKDATFQAGGGSVSIVPSEEGREFDPAGSAEGLDEAARRDPPREMEVRLQTVEPDMTTEDAEALNIHERVSVFTTYHSCCQPRVENIHRFADIVDGAIVRPGATFSLNGYVGRRTADKGFVPAPMIFDGEYVDDVGGGVSQFATTFFNAVFFGGYEDVYHKAHSYYISRYPAGREATISYPHPDLKFRNNSDAGILIKTSYSSTSISVAFYGDDGGKEISSESGERTNFTDPPEQRKPNPALPPGRERVTQSGSQGFDIVVYRIIEFPNGETKRERFFTRYQPEPRIIEYGPGTPAPSPTPEPTESPPSSPEPSPTPPPASSPPANSSVREFPGLGG